MVVTLRMFTCVRQLRVAQFLSITSKREIN